MLTDIRALADQFLIAFPNINTSYFWLDTLNAFVFGHGPISPTLADVLMLTGLDISTANNSHLFDTKPSSKVETRDIGGWSGYI